MLITFSLTANGAVNSPVIKTIVFDLSKIEKGTKSLKLTPLGVSSKAWVNGGAGVASNNGKTNSAPFFYAVKALADRYNAVVSFI
jgi:hypothetical protein